MRNYLLDKRLQLRYVVFVTLLSALISSTLGYLIWKQEDDASNTIIATFESSELADDALLKQAIVDRLTSDDHNLVLTMVGVGIGLVLVLSLYMVALTHRVAGPLYKVSQYFDQMSVGKLGEIYALRKGDMLTGFYEKFRQAHEAVRMRHRKENALVGKFLKACEQAGVGGEGAVAARLEELEKHHREREEALR